MRIVPFVALSVLLSILSYGQSWSNVLPSSRAVTWSNAGLPATLPDGETTPNPWTPPTRTQCGSTINPSGSASTDTTNINSALSSCGTGHFVLLGPGSFTVSNTIVLYTQSGVTLRGSGPQSTTVTLTSSAFFEFGAIYGSGSCAWSSGFSAGTTSITLTSCSSAPQVGTVLSLSQCNTGLTGSGCTGGTQADNGGIFVCGGVDNTCQRSGEGSQALNLEQQAVYVTSVVNKSGTYTVNFTPGLYMSNWNATGNNGTAANWTTGAHTITPYGNGVEDMTIYNAYDGASYSVEFNSAYASWVKGVRFVGSGTYYSLAMSGTKNCLISNSYFFSDPFGDSQYPEAIQEQQDSDDLILNNIMVSGEAWEGYGSMAGNVFAYNYARDTFTPYPLNIFEHLPGDFYQLYEGNETGTINEDNTHGTHDLNTAFRNYIIGYDAPYAVQGNPAGITFNPWDRFTNSIGNVIGTSGLNTSYQSLNQAAGGYVFSIGYGGGYSDTLSFTTSMRWGNWDSVTNAVRWCGNSSNSGWSTICGSTSEVPSGLASPNSALSVPVPSTTALPPSFFLPTAAAPNGGTGLSWWKVCKVWTTFPTNCGTYQTQPFPTAGPDVTGGPYSSGYAYDVPAQVAWQNLPIDSTYQKSYSIASSSWSGGTETLTFGSGVLPNVEHLMGGFQLAGAASACNPSGSELLITNSSSTTVSYALASNPGTSCSGTMKFPDVRQFDERVYQTDPAQAPAPSTVNPPTGVTATGK